MTADSEVSITGTPEASVVTGVRRSRGKNKRPAWRHDGPVSVIRLPLVVDDPVARRRVELLFWSMWQIKRAVQREARARVDGYQAGSHRRNADPKQWRTECGLTRERLERAAYRYLERSGWLAHHVTKALALHQADEVWTGVSRHLFPDSAGRYAGPPRVGSWWDYTRIPGRARSHTTPRKWETFRLHGTLNNHPVANPAAPRSWWGYDGPLMMVFGGGLSCPLGPLPSSSACRHHDY